MHLFYDLGKGEWVPARLNSEATCIVTDVIMGMLQSIPLGTAAERGLPKAKNEGGMEKDPKAPLPTITITYAFEERYKRHKGRRGGLITTNVVCNTLYIFMWIFFTVQCVFANSKSIYEEEKLK